MDKKRIGFVEKGKKEFKFNIDIEVVRYKVVTGERLSKDDNNAIDNYNQQCLNTNGEELLVTEDYIVWRDSIIDKYKEYSQEKREAFIFYLEHGIKMKKRIKEITVALATPVMVGIVLFFFEKIFNTDNNPIEYILLIIGFGVLYVFSIIQGMRLLEGFNIKQEVYEEFYKIIKG